MNEPLFLLLVHNRFSQSQANMLVLVNYGISHELTVVAVRKWKSCHWLVENFTENKFTTLPVTRK